MELFCYFVNKEGKPTKELFGYRSDELMPKELLWHFRDAFKTILDKEETPERAPGLTPYQFRRQRLSSNHNSSQRSNHHHPKSHQHSTQMQQLLPAYVHNHRYQINENSKPL